jgi:hypothetical protein
MARYCSDYEVIRYAANMPGAAQSIQLKRSLSRQANTQTTSPTGHKRTFLNVRPMSAYLRMQTSPARLECSDLAIANNNDIPSGVVWRLAFSGTDQGGGSEPTEN